MGQIEFSAPSEGLSIETEPKVLIKDAITLIRGGRVVAVADLTVDLTRVPPEHHMIVAQIAMQSGVRLHLPSGRPPDPKPPQKAPETSWWRRILRGLA